MSEHTSEYTNEHTSEYTPLAIPADVLKQLRDTDDSGRAMSPFTASEDGVPVDCVGSPLRCCLRGIEPGERVALVSYAPLRRWAAATGAEPGAYDEAGPVFVHAEECAGPAAGQGFPFAQPGALLTVRRYDAAGHIVGGRMLELPEDGGTATEQPLERALDEAFAEPGVALAHVRAVEYGCFQYEVRRP